MSSDVCEDESITEGPPIASCATALILLHTLKSSDKPDLTLHQSEHNMPTQMTGNALWLDGVEHPDSIPSLVSSDDGRNQKSLVDNYL